MKVEDFVKNEFHSYLEKKEYYHTLWTPEFKAHLSEFLRKWEKIRRLEKKYTQIPFLEYPDLPFAPSVKKDFEWQWRMQSLKVMEQELAGKTNATVLEIAGWNGWLSNRLKSPQNQLVSVDLFADELDGLSSMKHYKNSWHAIQCNTEQLDFFHPVFDVILVNHALPFFVDAAAYCGQLKKLLQPKGKLILLGLNFYKETSRKQQEIIAFQNYYMETHNFSVFFNESKG